MSTIPLTGRGRAPTFEGRSDELVSIDWPRKPSRLRHLKDPLYLPLLSASPFLPPALVEHLMRHKKDSALGVKYTPGDAVTNMEGAAHTFLTPITQAQMYGDYAYRGSHTVLPFPRAEGKDGSEGAWRAREVVVSAAIQPDFEDTQVMLALARLDAQPFQGEDGGSDWAIPSAGEKKDAGVRAAYDARLRAHLVHHLVGSLPALSDVTPLSLSDATEGLAAGKAPRGMYVELPAGIVSVELLWRAAIEAAANEFSALEGAAPQGYVYTSDPPAIFAAEADAKLLSRIQAAALAHLVSANEGQNWNMRVFAFNDYADPGALPLFERALAPTGAKVMPKSALFPAAKNGFYYPPEEARGALLVIHNNSDAFGQNIETEGPNSSLDGAIGSASTAAGSLRRDLPELTSRVLAPKARLATLLRAQ